MSPSARAISSAARAGLLMLVSMVILGSGMRGRSKVFAARS